MSNNTSWSERSDREIVEAVQRKELPFYALERILAPDYVRAIKLRREIVKLWNLRTNKGIDEIFDAVPCHEYAWDRVVGQNCENIIGYVPLPLGVAGPLLLDGVETVIPMATTEGALIASTHRGARAISLSSAGGGRPGGCITAVLHDGMTRAPVVEFDSLEEAIRLCRFCTDKLAVVRDAFESTTSFGKLQSVRCVLAGRKVHMRFVASTGDAMGMNMMTKGCDKALSALREHFPTMRVLALSGNFCTDKKSSAVNWVEGRGKTVVAEAVITAHVVEHTLKCSVDALVHLNVTKNLTGSALAGSVGGFNAHAANIVAAVFLATGQDPAQVIDSAACLTSMDKVGDDLVISVTMPSIEVGTIGGGTGLPAQRAMLDMMGCGGASEEAPGTNAQQLARLVSGAVLCGELSLMAGLAAGQLLDAHMKLNRKVPATVFSS